MSQLPCESDNPKEGEKPSSTTWYLEPLSDEANEMLAAVLDGLQTVNIAKNHLCADGKTRFLYQMPNHALAKRISRSKKNRYTMFRSQNDGRPDKVNFDKLGKSRKPTLTEVRETSDNIKLGAMMPKHRRR
jgi:hypothetical protein